MRGVITPGYMILREIRCARLNTFLCLMTVAVATGALVAMVTMSRASVDATRVLMKDLGFNLLITPASVDPARYQALDFQDVDMPEDYVTKLAESTVLAQHFVGKYQKTVPVDGCTIVLTGVLAEMAGRGAPKQPMPSAYAVSPGRVLVGSAASKALHVQQGSSLAILGRSFVVDRVLPEVGVIPDDIRVYAALHDVQEIVGRPGRINAIDALSCQCPGRPSEIVAALQQSIQSVLSDVTVAPYRSILLARESQRAMVERLKLAALAIVIAGSAMALWGLTHQNVRNRRREIGVFRAIGVPDARIGALFMGKILHYSVGGVLLGCAAGHMVALLFPMISEATLASPTPGHVAPEPSLMLTLLIVTPLAAIVFGLPPILSGLLEETSDVLGDAQG